VAEKTASPWRRLGPTLLLLAILAVALALRLYNIDWDEGYLLHPDERQVLIVVSEISFPWPPDLATLLSKESSWNPKFFAYGSLPIYLLHACTRLAALFDPDLAVLELRSYQVGRVLSALFDVGTVYLLYRLGRKLFDERVGLLAAALLAFTVLHIQQAHFYVVDPVLTFMVAWVILLAVDVVRQPRLGRALGLGVVWGMAMATKISAAPLLGVLAVAWLAGMLAQRGDGPHPQPLSQQDWERGAGTGLPLPSSGIGRGAGGAGLSHPSPSIGRGAGGEGLSLPSPSIGRGAGGEGHPRPRSWFTACCWAFLGGTLTCAVGLVVFALCEPYAVIDKVTFWVDIIHEAMMSRGAIDLPFTRQFYGTPPYLTFIWQAVVWSMGIPLGVAGFGAAVVALVVAVDQALRGNWRRAGELGVPLAWAVGYFVVVGGSYAKFLRYLLPLTPFLCLWAAWGLWALWGASGRAGGLRRVVGAVGLVAVLGGTMLYALAFMHIYTVRHPWLQVTAWLCEHLPIKSNIIVEHWDNPLPLLQGLGELRCYRHHEVSDFKGYDPDDTQKLEDMLTLLSENDWIILATNRLYNSIPRQPRRYPLTTRYYELLFAERLGFELVHYEAVYPELFGVAIVDETLADFGLATPRLLAEREAQRPQLNLGRADESYTVYDHPKPLIFRKTLYLTRQELLALLGEAAQNLPPPKPKITK
jgi:hypothetical protein